MPVGYKGTEYLSSDWLRYSISSPYQAPYAIMWNSLPFSSAISCQLSMFFSRCSCTAWQLLQSWAIKSKTIIAPRSSFRLNQPVSLTISDSIPVLFKDSNTMLGIGSGSASDWKISSILSNIVSAPKEITTNIIAAIPNAFQVSERLKTP